MNYFDPLTVNQAALLSAIALEFVYKHDGKYIIYDRFFGMWLRKNENI